ncbi:MAG: polyprenyl synthetase family protein [Candidatus Bathyarchaeia archaeon]
MKNKKPLKNQKKLMVKALDLLQKNSIRALEKAKEQILNEKLESEKARKALKYYAENWNDTTHPGILALACKAIGGNITKAEQVQIAMLYLSAAIDLLDDVLDKSKVKNGKPTVFGRYGQDIALLLSNAMMIKGFTLLYGCSKDFTQETFKALMETIKADFYEMGNANLLEIDLKGKVDVSPEICMSILEKKAASIAIHIKIGAIIGGGSLEEIEALTTYGKILGMLIILREEFIDIFEPAELKNRIKNEILPVPILFAFKDRETKRKILNILSKPKVSEEDASKIVEYVFQSKNVEKLRRRLKRLANNAVKSLSIFKRIRNKELELLIKGAIEDL